jgi:uridine kinase
MAVDLPVYDFHHSRRLATTERFSAGRLLIVEGTMLFAVASVRRCFDLRVFVDSDADLRLARRVLRDVEERGRSVESVIRQYTRIVRPMHLKFVEPSRRYADVIIRNDGTIAALRRATARLEERLVALLRRR